jgi:uncharacterized protein (TIGR01777 family)
MKQNFLITGGSGMIGSEIINQLQQKGHKVKNLSTRKLSDPNTFQWNPSKHEYDIQAFENVDYIIHLAGSSISKRWTKKNKKNILNSRIQSTVTLFKAIESLPKDKRPRHLISASAIGIYPSHPSKIYTETDEADNDFLADVVLKWEKEIFKISSLDIRVCCLRIGLVLGKNGGILSTLLPFFKFGLGSPLGTGKQWMPWIHVSDLSRQFLYLSENDMHQGIFLGVGKESISNNDFGKILAKSLRRPYFIPPIPSFFLYMILGSKAKLALMSTRCSSDFWKNQNFRYEYPNLEDALNDLIAIK